MTEEERWYKYAVLVGIGMLISYHLAEVTDVVWLKKAHESAFLFLGLAWGYCVFKWVSYD